MINFVAPKNEAFCRNYVPKNNIHFYVDFHTFTVPFKWLNLLYHALLILYLFYVTYFKLYGWGIKPPKKAIIEVNNNLYITEGEINHG